ncbi:hypothetical protein N1851_023890 [Merluccius polli]|uniref:Uncharacterized protein n=1 Tax=Merluccius polli TaxID=89951 RepID=A0AA47MG04_MERPO|nr:hypothetical protein N1851_023890 [Merluccius polli]
MSQLKLGFLRGFKSPLSSTLQDSELSLNTPETVATMNPLSLLNQQSDCDSDTIASVTPGSSVTLTVKPTQQFTEIVMEIYVWYQQKPGEAPKPIVKLQTNLYHQHQLGLVAVEAALTSL